jgi:hypothetical protein
MCNHVFCGDATLATPRQLASLVAGPAGLVWREHRWEMDWCLCAIDVPRTLDRAGLRWQLGATPETFIVEH